MLRKDFDLLRNSRSTVPMYADERELLAFRTFSQSGSVPKKLFDTLQKTGMRRFLCYLFKYSSQTFRACSATTGSSTVTRWPFSTVILPLTTV